LEDLVDRAGDHAVTVTAVVPRDDTFAALAAHARIATVLENLTSAGVSANRIKLVINPEGLLAADAVFVRTDVDP
jgi:hypothetical protein